VSVFATLEACDLVQSFVKMWLAIRHWVESVLVLCVRHEVLPVLVDWAVVLLLEVGRHLVAHVDFVANLAAVVAGDDDLFGLVVLLHRTRQLKPWMCLRTGLADRTESGEIVHA